jgi:hypothetical protein
MYTMRCRALPFHGWDVVERCANKKKREDRIMRVVAVLQSDTISKLFNMAGSLVDSGYASMVDRRLLRGPVSYKARPQDWPHNRSYPFLELILCIRSWKAFGEEKFDFYLFYFSSGSKARSRLSQHQDSPPRPSQSHQDSKLYQDGHRRSSSASTIEALELDTMLPSKPKE